MERMVASIQWDSGFQRKNGWKWKFKVLELSKKMEIKISSDLMTIEWIFSLWKGRGLDFPIGIPKVHKS